VPAGISHFEGGVAVAGVDPDAWAVLWRENVVDRMLGRLGSLEDEIRTMLQQLGADPAPELVAELTALAAPMGSWPRQQIVDASWRIESAAVLAWALGHTSSLPAYDRQAAPARTFLAATYSDES